MSQAPADPLPRRPPGRRLSVRSAVVAVALAVLVAGPAGAAPAGPASGVGRGTQLATHDVAPAGAPSLSSGAEGSHPAPGPAGDPGARASSSTSATASSAIARTDRVIIHWRPDTAGLEPGTHEAASPGRLDGLTAATGRNVAFVRLTGSGASVYDLGAPLGENATLILDAIRRAPGVASVEPDAWMTIAAAPLPNDTYASNLWGLVDGAVGSPAGHAYGVGVLDAWPTTAGLRVDNGSPIVVAVVDTGLVYAHPDLAGQALPGWDMVSTSSTFDHTHDGDGRDSNAADPGDWCLDSQGGIAQESTWHGTHVAGTIAAMAGNNLGVFGGAPAVKIQPVRVLGSCGGYASDIQDGIRWAAGAAVAGTGVNATPARVINVSLGGNRACSAEDQAAVDAARSHNAVVVVAAGNSDLDARGFSPANCAGVITVAAIDINGRKASFSNFGPAVEIAAPGVDIYSTLDTGTTTPTGVARWNSTNYYDGTSMATPHVTLSAALVAAAYPGLSPDAIAATLIGTATPVAPDTAADSCPTRGCGAGVVNVGRAIATLATGAPIVAAVSTPRLAVNAAGTIQVVARVADPTGVASADASLDGGPWMAMSAADAAFGGTIESVTGSVTVPAPPVAGGHDLCVRASDGSHVGSACITLTVDLSAPTVTDVTLTSPGAFPGSSVGLTSSQLDDLSNVAGVDVRIDAGAWTPMLPSDGAFNTATEHAGLAIAGSAATTGSGYGHSCAVRPDGTVWCWGYDSDGQLGFNPPDSTHPYTPMPTMVAGLAGVSSVVGGGFHTCALIGTGGVRCWGFNDYGALGNGTTATTATPVAAAGISTATAVAAGRYHTCAVLANGSLRCWGNNGDGELGDNTYTNRPSPVTVRNLSGVVGVATGAWHSCALLANGTVRCWGANNQGQLGDGTTVGKRLPVTVPGLTGVVAISAGDFYTCALRSDHTARCWGYNADGQLGDATKTRRLKPVAVFHLAGAIALRTAAYHACAVLSDHTMRCWGWNGDGELGDGTTTGRLAPVVVKDAGGATMSGVTAVSAGMSHTCAVRSAGVLQCWGYNGDGELGDGTMPDRYLSRSQPGTVFGFTGALVAGTHQVCVRAHDAADNLSTGADCRALVVGSITGRLTTGTVGASASAPIPVRLDWTSGAEAGGVNSYWVQRSDRGGGWTTIVLPSPTARTINVSQAPGAASAFRVLAVHGAAQSPAIVGPRIIASSRQDGTSYIAYGGSGWSTSSSSGFYGGTVKYSRTAGRTATMRFVGSSVAWVATKAKDRGKAEVWLDGRRVATLSLYSSSTRYRQVAWAASVAPTGSHTVVIKVLGTHQSAATATRVDVDAFLVVAPAP